MNDNVNRLGHTLADCAEFARAIALELAALRADAERYRWLLGYLLDHGSFPTYPMIGLSVDTHQVDSLIDGFIRDEVNSPEDSRNRIMGQGKYTAIDAARKP